MKDQRRRSRACEESESEGLGVKEVGSERNRASRDHRGDSSQ